MCIRDSLYSCGIACSCEGCKTKAGNYQIDLLLANVCKQNITRFPYEIVRLAEDIAGGLMVTMPSQKDFESGVVCGRNGETVGEICNKYFAGRPDVSTEDRMRVLRFLENVCLGSAAVGYRTAVSYTHLPVISTVASVGAAILIVFHTFCRL